MVTLSCTYLARDTCKVPNVNFSKASFCFTYRWTPGPRPEDGLWAAWWYKSVHESSGWRPFDASKDKQAKEALPPLSPELQELLDQCMPAYEKLKRFAINL